MLGIDIGSNTLRAILMDQNYNKLQSEEFIIAAAKNMQNTNINQEAIKRLFSALNSLKNKNYNLKNAKAVATAAFRKANNTKEIFEKIKSDFGLKIDLIDSNTEAYLSILGMKTRLQKLNLFRKDFNYCDLGGASCEITNTKFSKSYDFGIISFYEKNTFKRSKHNIFVNFLKKNPQRLKFIKNKQLKLHFSNFHPHFKQLVLEAFKEVQYAKKSLKNKYIALNSGVPTTLCAYKHGIKYIDYTEEKVNGTLLTSRDFLIFAIKIWNLEQKKAKIYLGENRKKYLIAGALLLYALFDKEKLIVVDDGVREGVCIAYFKNIIYKGIL
ncbi:Ppx/GppA phosphatase family protein [Campylobacter insulaenigrae]|uniref:Ppx/GppA phosphatase family protein n=1 Tax=Campylobacter insulaenigrae TaxID=260714 RepID=UPI002152383A|nr:Ppx/GppA family phosphatase [Campylobacter insulaenigrae]MCR6593590.1 Ppx/GppA family phosphatase [Campylobacter insulaenigrae]